MSLNHNETDDQQKNYFLEEFLIEPACNRISLGEKTYTVEPRIMDVLCVLADQPGKVVSRKHIIEKVWEHRTVSDSSLSRNIARLRKIIDQKSPQQSYIKTIPKKGYLLNATIREENQDNAELLPQKNQINHNLATLFNDAENNQVTSMWFRLPIKQVLSLLILAVIILLSTQFQLINNIFPGLSSLPENSQEKKDEIQMAQKDSSHQYDYQVTLTPSQENKAFCLDGVDDFIELNNQIDIDTGDLSISAWVKTKSKSLVTIVDKRHENIKGNVKGFSLYLVDGSVGFQLANGEGDWHCSNHSKKSACSNWNTKAFVADNKWHLVSVTLDRDDTQGLKFFIDGQYFESKDPTMRQGSLLSSAPLRIGSRSSSISSLFPGNIGEVRIYNRVLKKSEITQHYATGISRSCRAQ
ncbi:LamG-like jellyroll fold domain-containing protein [Aliikangiella coralliicola]|uniref:OmpR/PhoB-type domain-containing protein n=1 Tax=Aliikangiella coralliicola TaxID=2592383 RepID=A0A545UFD4_9GAMM|nr:LamG-like jellyroll fold domain-containing protein [Aliikangiella coralliicola]TQV88178.1 hypothetical protein FLL46_06520 [Aliikangiella coralliicola]